MQTTGCGNELLTASENILGARPEAEEVLVLLGLGVSPIDGTDHCLVSEEHHSSVRNNSEEMCTHSSI